ncbi:MAG TPA: proton-conducting transporter membrane subunit, partial [Rubricoccaceae bacterium]|nr:proton-conducting transporter membrane subunit [Rubricoccaceae bacterium]
FLGSGSVIHAMHHVEHEVEHRRHHEAHGHHEPFDPQDMRTMGNLRRYLPQTHWTFLVATLAIAGLPPLAGFFSKDEILFSAFRYGQNYDVFWAHAVWLVGLGTALLTAIYMGRCYLLTFEGEERWPAALDVRPHESPWTMTVPLVVLAALSAVGGFLGLPALLGSSWIHHWLGAEHGGPVFEAEIEWEVSHSTEWGLLALGGAIAVVGLLIAWARWGRRELEADSWLRYKMGALYRVLAGKYFVDELYDATVVKPVVGGARRVLAPFDEKGVDGAVNGLARFVRNVGAALRPLQTGFVQHYALAVVVGVVVVVAVMLFVGG